jgi:hypothetical protein
MAARVPKDEMIPGSVDFRPKNTFDQWGKNLGPIGKKPVTNPNESSYQSSIIRKFGKPTMGNPTTQWHAIQKGGLRRPNWCSQKWI